MESNSKQLTEVEEKKLNSKKKVHADQSVADNNWQIPVKQIENKVVLPTFASKK